MTNLENFVPELYYVRTYSWIYQLMINGSWFKARGSGPGQGRGCRVPPGGVPGPARLGAMSHEQVINGKF